MPADLGLDRPAPVMPPSRQADGSIAPAGTAWLSRPPSPTGHYAARIEMVCARCGGARAAAVAWLVHVVVAAVMVGVGAAGLVGLARPAVAPLT